MNTHLINVCKWAIANREFYPCKLQLKTFKLVLTRSWNLLNNSWKTKPKFQSKSKVIEINQSSLLHKNAIWPYNLYYLSSERQLERKKVKKLKVGLWLLVQTNLFSFHKHTNYSPKLITFVNFIWKKNYKFNCISVQSAI